ncbi:hypothetical protein CEV33_4413 [Brucella grignonensis]|uniref:Uncharacterized protein n=1 Tax=Brucella grignonensis TaxID=94627 RepID=A0A256FNJ2_9HYPH|nr:hypothetical protein CEV33_4413 [Brucella grignonensis]
MSVDLLSGDEKQNSVHIYEFNSDFISGTMLRDNAETPGPNPEPGAMS